MATGHRKLLEQLELDGIAHIFGNPGSTEEGLLDEISRCDSIQYVLGLQEAAVVLMANGYALATRKPTIVQLHSSVGLGNALGSLYHVFRKQRSPLVVLAGEAGMAYDALEAHMWIDLAGFARPVTKYAARAVHPGSVLRLLRRCIKIAATPPVGPTFLALPQDVLDQLNEEPLHPTVIPDTRLEPDPAAVARASALLATARHPVILAGDGVAHAGASAELSRLAGVLGAGVWGAMASEVSLPWTDPLYQGLTGHMFGASSRRVVEDADAVVICGTYVFPEVFPLLEDPFRPDAQIVHIDLDANAIAKNHRVTLGLVSDPRLTLRRLADGITGRMTPGQRRAAAERAEQLATARTRSQASAMQSDEARHGGVPLRMPAFAEALAKRLPPDSVIFDETLTYSAELMRYVAPSAPGRLFQTPGGTLGVGLPGAVGAKLALPDRTVVGLAGDGGAMYTYQALWTAAHLDLGAKFVVCNNRSYRLLKENIVAYRREQHSAAVAFPPSFDLTDPGLDFVALAAGLGVPGLRVSEPGDVEKGVNELFDHAGPFLLELMLEGDVQP
jgi:benzoylformate decarboxylase